MDWAKTTARGDEKHLSFEIWCDLYKRFYGRLLMVSYSSSFSNALSVSLCLFVADHIRIIYLIEYINITTKVSNLHNYGQTIFMFVLMILTSLCVTRCLISI